MSELRRIRPLPSITNDVMYGEYQESLKRYTTEYEYYKVKNPSWESLNQKAEEFDKESDAYISLKNRARLIKNGEYGVALEKNIAAYVLAIVEYEAKQTNTRPLDVAKGFVNKDPKIMEYLQNRFMKARAEREGTLGAELIPLAVQSKEDVITEIFEEYDFINIEKPELSLVPVTANPSQVVETVQKMLENYLETAGIAKEINEYRKSRESSMEMQGGTATVGQSQSVERENLEGKAKEKEKERE